MPTIIQTTIRADIDSMFLSRDAGGTLFVDKEFAGATDDNDGLSATSPKLTITGAIAAAGSGWRIRVAPGSYIENIVVPTGYEGLIIEGRDRLGANRTTLSPASGIPVEINSNNVEIYNMEIIAGLPAPGDTHNTALYLTGLNHKIHDLSIIGNSANCWGIWIDDADFADIHDCYIDGSYNENGIGIFVGNDSITCKIYKNHITKWGSGAGDGGIKNGYGIGRHINAQRTLIMENDILDNFVGIYYYPPTGETDIEGDSIVHNNFAENSSYDIYDTHDYPKSAINIDSNFYGYSTGGLLWYADNNGDNVADSIIFCGTNRDRHPLAGPHIWRGVVGGLPRFGGLI
jgi:hypothetical protein